MKEWFALTAVFAKMGALTFGGGYAMMPLAQRELVDKRNWATMEEIADYFTVAMVTPGIIAVNLCTFVGFSRKGILGGALATVSFCLLPVTLITTAALLLNNFAGNEAVVHALAGVRLAVGALIAQTVINFAKSAVKDWKQVIIAIACFIWSIAFKANPTILVIAAGCAGFLLWTPRPPRNSQTSQGK